MSKYSLHSEWLSLIDVSGPFLAEPVLDSVFPQGLSLLDSNKKRSLRQAYYELKDSQDEGEAIYHKLHDAWIKFVLSDVLEWDEDRTGENLKTASLLGSHFTHTVMGQTVQLKPDYIFSANSSIEAAEILVVQYPAETKLDAALNTDGWIASPSEHMVELCRAKDVRLGLITNGEHWMFIDAPIGGITTFASWYSGIWVQEPKTLQAFVNLFELRRFFLPQGSQLPALLDRSVEFQDDVTEALGEQVGRAVEVLIQAFDRADIDRNHTLLSGVKPTELYEAGLTIMMRIVFLLSAEERGLLLLGDERYESNYAITTLRSQLRETSDEILEKRWDAWSRLLALFRAVYGGVDHQTMRLPALGGSLFDPDRFPFLEGRGKGTKWLEAEAKPLPIDNRTVLLLLEAVQIYNGRTLSYRALDVEQIGYVYEGLLERTAVKAKDVTLDLKATKNAKNPWVTLAEIEEAIEADSIPKLLKERTGSSVTRIKNDLAKHAESAALSKLLIACQNDEALRDKLAPFIHFIRFDNWGYPLIYPKGSFMVASGMDRRESGTHYTPKSLTEKIVETTLTPLAYMGPSQGLPQDKWELKSPKDILDLRICDPAMGSGAFLVQVCRWLSDKLVEAWLTAERNGQVITIEGKISEANTTDELAPVDIEERLTLAKRLVAERCLYGVDMNPLAVELAKLSIWLITLSKDRPFGFLDHNLKSGNSLLGVYNISQFNNLDVISPEQASKKLFAHDADQALKAATDIRKDIRRIPVKDIFDIRMKENLENQAQSLVHNPIIIADALVAEYVASKSRVVDTTKLSVIVGQVLNGDERSISEIKRRARLKLSQPSNSDLEALTPFHWPLEFPEVFDSEHGGFDAIVGNPPWGASLSKEFKNWISKSFKYVGDYETAIAFIERASLLTRSLGTVGYVLPNTLLLNDSSEAIRKRISKYNRIMSIIDHTNISFFRDASVRSCLLSYQKVNTPENFYIYAFPINKADQKTHKLSQPLLSQRKHWSRLDLPPLLIPEGSVTLSEIFDVKQGYIPYRKSSLISKYGEPEGIAILKERRWHSPTRIDDDSARELKGKDVSPFKVEWTGGWVQYGEWVSTYLKPDWFQGERILVREIVGPKPNLIIAGRTDGYLVHNPSIICVKQRDGTEFTKFAEIYLNSELASAYIADISSKVSKGMFPKVLVKDLRQLPFPNPSRITSDILAEAESLSRKFNQIDYVDFASQCSNLVNKTFGLGSDNE